MNEAGAALGAKVRARLRAIRAEMGPGPRNVAQLARALGVKPASLHAVLSGGSPRYRADGAGKMGRAAIEAVLGPLGD